MCIFQIHTKAQNAAIDQVFLEEICLPFRSIEIPNVVYLLINKSEMVTIKLV